MSAFGLSCVFGMTRVCLDPKPLVVTLTQIAAFSNLPNIQPCIPAHGGGPWRFFPSNIQLSLYYCFMLFA